MLQVLVDGLAVGSLYALAALGLVLVYKTSHVVNFGHGELAMVAAFLAFSLITRGLPVWGAILLAALAAGALGALFEGIILRPVRHASVLTLIIVTLGLNYVLNGSAGAIWGHDSLRFPPIVSGAPFMLAGVALSRHSLVVLVTVAALIALLYWFLSRAKYGRAMRAIAENVVAARLMGVPVSLLMMLTWFASSVLGATAGVLIAPMTFLHANMMQEVILKAFAAAVLGGLDSVAGAVVGGVTLGIVENIIGRYIATEMKTAFAFTLLVLMLAIRPSGLLGTRVVKKV